MEDTFGNTARRPKDLVPSGLEMPFPLAVFRCFQSNWESSPQMGGGVVVSYRRPLFSRAHMFRPMCRSERVGLNPLTPFDIWKLLTKKIVFLLLHIHVIFPDWYRRHPPLNYPYGRNKPFSKPVIYHLESVFFLSVTFSRCEAKNSCCSPKEVLAKKSSRNLYLTDLPVWRPARSPVSISFKHLGIPLRYYIERP